MKTRQFINNNFLIVALAIVIAIFLLIVAIANAQKQSNTDYQSYGRGQNNMRRMHTDNQSGNYGRGQGYKNDSNMHIEQAAPSGAELTQQAKDALYKALDDEYKSQATYQAVINKLGNVKPFSMIIKAEQMHINSLVTLLNYYKLDVLTNPYNNVTAKDTLADNCSIGVQTETDNASLYRDTLLPAVSAYPDLTATFTNLMNASQQKHLPAFSRCAN